MAAPGRPERYGYDGLAQVAHAIRRSAAAFIAMSITAPEEGMEGMFANADKVAAWIGGKALVQEEAAPPPSGSPLGQAWPPTD